MITDKSFRWLNEDSLEFLKKGYLKGEETVSSRVIDIATHAFKDEKKRDRFIDYMCKGFISLSSPVWSNFGRKDMLSISCFGSYIEDTSGSILFTNAEIGMMTKYGGGTSAYISKIRPRGSKISKGGKSDGAVHFSRLLETTVDVFQQSDVRRGSCAVYMDIEHGDINEFLEIRSEGSRLQDIFPAVCVSNKWLEDMEAGDSKKRETWAKVIQARQETGVPYIFFKDNANEGRPLIYKDNNLEISMSNLCSEIMLPNNKDESFVCCLASLNAYHFDEWVDTDVVEILTEFLDVVLDDFIENSANIMYFGRARNFAKRHRAIGIGVLGYHSYLQRNLLPFESMEAKLFNGTLFRTIKERSYKASEQLGMDKGYAPLFEQWGGSKEKWRRNTTTMAVAPTTSSSFILGQVSQGIEPFRDNYYVRDMAKGKVGFRNPELTKLLEEKERNTPDVWNSIGKNFGSVQHLDFLTNHEKEVFKTFSEISQMEILQQ